ncbi:MAG TPA: S41 family peptidase [Thermoanaerobaculaceae bacterium]|nr:S41 family peptidase [Thermoanaerobaculaceae bacterium]
MRVPTRVVLSAAVIVAGALAGAVAGPAAEGLGKADEFLRRYSEVLRILIDKAPRPVEADQVVYSSLDGMLELLDPHSNFLPPAGYAQIRERQQGSFHGVGVQISMRGGRVTVITPIEGTPAARMGLRAGDIIDSIDGVSTDGMDLDDVARRLRGPEGSTVRITILRPGLGRPLEVSLQRARVPTDSVRYALLLDPTTAYVRISDFTRTTGNEVSRALERLTGEGATRLLLDLRDNPGGIVDTAVAVSGFLLEPGQLVFSTKGRTADSFQDYRAARDGLHFPGPVVVLVNRGSASASEIVAGCIQDHDRGLVIGETSFGKGVVQTIYPLRDSALALTTAKYYTPSGRCIQRDFDSFFAYVNPDGENNGLPAPAKDAGPVFFTDSGRKVFGGGGITPDVHTAAGVYSERVARLLGQAAFFHFAVGYLADKTDKDAIARSFAVTPEIVQQFKDKVLAQKWLPEAELDAALANATDRRDIELNLQAEISNAGLSLTDGYRVLLQNDNQAQEALRQFPEAAQLYEKARVAVPQDRR